MSGDPEDKAATTRPAAEAENHLTQANGWYEYVPGLYYGFVTTPTSDVLLEQYEWDTWQSDLLG
jgi:hypothetical protein